MLFQTGTFFLFFLLFFLAYYGLRKQLAWQNHLLLAASYFFYAWWDIRFLILIVGGTAFAYVVGPAVNGERIGRRQLLEGLGWMGAGGLISLVPDATHNGVAIATVIGAMALTAGLALLFDRLPAGRQVKPALVLGVAANLLLLGFFKYFNFFADSFARITNLFGGDVHWTTANIILPIGISFFTFQKIAYLLDIRRRDFPPSRDILTFASFVAYFPQLVAGPIERPTHLYPQFARPRRITAEGLQSGAMLFLWGMYKKVVIADNLAPVVNDVFGRAGTASTGDLLVGLLAFTFQIYGDFSGYTDMARGLARMMGFELILNFRLPYFARTPSEFWERWHISLSSWLRDYLYISLGGNRGGKWHTYRNLFLTMLLGGLWHGANWTFIAWGAFHGLILIAYRLADVDRQIMPRVNRLSAASPALGLAANIPLWLLMSALTLIGWLLFRAPDLLTVTQYLSGLSSGFDMHSSLWGSLAFFTVPLILVQCWQRWTGRLYFLDEAVPLVRLNLLLFILFSILFLAPKAASDFIYFAF